MIERIEGILNGMSQRRILFVTGDHLSGKTKLITECLNKWFGNESSSHYVDVGLYIKNKITEEQRNTYKIFPEEFREEADVFFKQLMDEKYKDSRLLVFDHMEFLLSEQYTGWIGLLDKVTIKDNVAIVVAPSEYEKSLPLLAYKHLRV